MKKTLAAVLCAPALVLSPLLLQAAGAEQGPGNGATCFYDPAAPPAVATIAGSGFIVGTAGNDVIVGSPGRDTILAGEGDDIICGNGGNDIIEGGGGNDVIVGDVQTENPASATGSRDTFLGGSGDDLIFGSAGRDTVVGGDGADDVIGNGGNDVLVAGDGDDIGLGGPGNDVVAGGDGNDDLWGNFGSDTVVAGDGSDYVNGDNPNAAPPGPLNPAINPTPNDDYCSGGGGLDTVVNCERTGEATETGGPAGPTPNRPPRSGCMTALTARRCSRTHRSGALAVALVGAGQPGVGLGQVQGLRRVVRW